MSFCVRDPVTLGPALWVGTAVTEVTSLSKISEVQLAADVPEMRTETFLASPCFNGNGDLPQ